MQLSEKVMDHFRNPRNQGKIKNADAEAQAVSSHCGDSTTIYLKVKKDKDGFQYISDIGFETMGCGAAVASASVTTELAKNKKIEEALKISVDDVAKELEGLPLPKIHCGQLAVEALHKAIKQIS